MSSLTTTETQTRQQAQRGKRGNRGRGGNRGGPARGARGSNGGSVQSSNAVKEPKQAIIESAKVVPEAATEADDAAVCWICAEPVKYYSVSACNHRTCHVCSLRLRALYKKLDCTFCKEPQPTVIFTSSPDAQFSSYTPDSIPHKDPKLSIHFETQDMMEETLILLRFNCPDVECDYTASGWGDLKLHVRAMHGKMLCDLCIRFKKVFAHEHALYPPNMLPLHLPSMPHRSNKQALKEPIEGGIHPLCAFCRECFFSDDELFVHMRERHEECFICKRNEVRDQYFQNYESLEQHFAQAHFACTNPSCQAQKFVVFGSALDLKAHQVEVHGADMSSRDKRDARRVQAEFEFDDTGGNRRGRRDRGDREREPPPLQNQNTTHAVPRGVVRRREGFGGHITAESGGNQTVQSSGPSRRASPSPPRGDVDPIVAERHAAFIARLQAAAPNPNSAVPAVKAAIRGYRTNELSARDLISTVWNILDNNLDDTASIINGVVDILDEDEKKSDLLASWNGFKIEQRHQFPDLVPTAVGSGYAGIASGRVLNAKHVTATRSSQQSSRQVWDRVAQAASSSSLRPVPGTSSASRPAERFPALAGPSNSGFRQPQRNTPWASSSSTGARPSSSIPTPALKKASTATSKPPPLSAAAFPELPALTNTRTKPSVGGNRSLRNIMGDSTPTSSAWRPNGSIVTTPDGTPALSEAEVTVNESTSGKGKKGKGKQKQTLFTLGAFPT
ncbi:hypothetical protein HYDPIDRAFT_100159 [Hydnomerulius pinastri MD-312]|uniref:RING-type E3 ubiquitin transferase n=1 Tax=Hydnomerulius pinastri MD-312 TaxID=994086 RepID=A0A0C9W9S2_9AGAM|nr:hypothetical protein HYDPIDRAFT_100159 [Hydnomerulius pinastri MD-312]